MMGANFLSQYSNIISLRTDSNGAGGRVDRQSVRSVALHNVGQVQIPIDVYENAASIQCIWAGAGNVSLQADGIFKESLTDSDAVNSRMVYDYTLKGRHSLEQANAMAQNLDTLTFAPTRGSDMFVADLYARNSIYYDAVLQNTEDQLKMRCLVHLKSGGLKNLELRSNKSMKRIKSQFADRLAVFISKANAFVSPSFATEAARAATNSALLSLVEEHLSSTDSLSVEALKGSALFKIVRYLYTLHDGLALYEFEQLGANMVLFSSSAMTNLFKQMVDVPKLRAYMAEQYFLTLQYHQSIPLSRLQQRVTMKMISGDQWLQKISLMVGNRVLNNIIQVPNYQLWLTPLLKLADVNSNILQCVIKHFSSSPDLFDTFSTYPTVPPCDWEKESVSTTDVARLRSLMSKADVLLKDGFVMDASERAPAYSWFKQYAALVKNTAEHFPELNHFDYKAVLKFSDQLTAERRNWLPFHTDVSGLTKDEKLLNIDDTNHVVVPIALPSIVMNDSLSGVTCTWNNGLRTWRHHFGFVNNVLVQRNLKSSTDVSKKGILQGRPEPMTTLLSSFREAMRAIDHPFSFRSQVDDGTDTTIMMTYMVMDKSVFTIGMYEMFETTGIPSLVCQLSDSNKIELKPFTNAVNMYVYLQKMSESMNKTFKFFVNTKPYPLFARPDAYTALNLSAEEAELVVDMGLKKLDLFDATPAQMTAIGKGMTKNELTMSRIAYIKFVMTTGKECRATWHDVELKRAKYIGKRSPSTSDDLQKAIAAFQRVCPLKAHVNDEKQYGVFERALQSLLKAVKARQSIAPSDDKNGLFTFLFDDKPTDAIHVLPTYDESFVYTNQFANERRFFK